MHQKYFHDQSRKNASKKSRKNNVEANLFLPDQRKWMLLWDFLDKINTKQEAEDHAII